MVKSHYDKNYFLGIDNGISGSVGLLSETYASFFPTPSKKHRSYTKEEQYVSRIEYKKFYNMLESFLTGKNKDEVVVLLERPMINSGRFKATMSAARALESTLIMFEMLGFETNDIEYIDSRIWQHYFFPEVKGTPELKKASLDLGIKLFPEFEKQIIKQKDADGILISEYGKRRAWLGLNERTSS